MTIPLFFPIVVGLGFDPVWFGVLIVLAFMEAGSSWLLTGIGLVCLAGGVFQIYEAWSGWCVMRAMGFKTPM